MKGLKSTVALLAVLPVLASCSQIFGYKVMSGGLYAAAHGVFSDPDVNLKAKNYAAADHLAVKLKGNISPYQSILALPLEEVDQAGISSEFGENVAEGIGLRLDELGYKVLLHEVTITEGGTRFYKPSNDNAADFVLTGTYRVNRDNVDVFLHVLNAKSGRVVERFDYQMPLSREVRNLARAEAKIFKIEK